MGSILNRLFGNNEPIKLYSKEELEELEEFNKIQLEQIVKIVEMRNPPNKSFHSFSSPKIQTALAFSFKLLGNRFGNSIEKQKKIEDYENEIKKTKLELVAEEISLEDYNLKTEIYKTKLLAKVWDIANTPEEIVNKLYALELISSKQKEVCLSQKKENDEIKNKNEKMLQRDYYFIDYIIEHQ